MRPFKALCASIACIAALIGSFSAPAQALEDVTYLFPAPPILPAFGPIQLAKGKGYFEDRRPAANCDPYEVCRIMLETICS